MKNNNNIILIGFMATGKTAVGQSLSKKLHLKYVSIDTLVEKKSRCKISTIFKNNGEHHFRELETKALFSLKNEKNLAIACGGGIILRKENRKALKELGIVIWLKADARTINKRLKALKQRPLLNIKNEEERKKIINKMLKQRYRLYKDTADYAVRTDDLTISEVTKKIIEKLKKSNQRPKKPACRQAGPIKAIKDIG